MSVASNLKWCIEEKLFKESKIVQINKNVPIVVTHLSPLFRDWFFI